MKKLLLFIIYFPFSILLNAQAPNFQWAKSMGSPYDDQGCSIKTDASGNVYSTGVFRDTVDFDPGIGTYKLIASGNNWNTFVLKLDASGNFIWAKNIGGTSSVLAISLALDAASNVYTTGSFDGTADFDPGIGTYTLMGNGGGSQDVFILKLDLLGNFIWARNLGGNQAEQPYCIATDAIGNVYTTGEYSGVADFDPGIGTYTLSSVGINFDAFISKLNSSGTFVWAKSIGGTSNDIANSIAVDLSGNVYTTGYFSGTMDFDPGIGTYTITSVGADDIFISKLDASGNFVWGKNFGGTSYEYGQSIAVDGSGNVFTTGNFDGVVDFDPNIGTYTLVTSGSPDIYVSKLNTNGVFAWAKQMSGVSYDIGQSIAVDGMGNVYTTGYFSGVTDFDPGLSSFTITPSGSSDMFISKLDPSGNFNWVEQIGGNGATNGYCLALDAIGNLYSTGWYTGTCDFDPTVSTFPLTSNGPVWWDIFIQKLSTTTLGVNENFIEYGFSIYPNPTSGIFKISVSNSKQNNSVEIYNSIGTLILRQNNLDIIDLSNNANGLYFVKVMSDDAIVGMQKVVKE